MEWCKFTREINPNAIFLLIQKGLDLKLTQNNIYKEHNLYPGFLKIFLRERSMTHWYDEIDFDKEKIRQLFCVEVEKAIGNLEVGLQNFLDSNPDMTDKNQKTRDQLKGTISKHKLFLEQLQAVELKSFSEKDLIESTAIVIWGSDDREYFHYAETAIEFILPFKIICDVEVIVENYPLFLSNAENNELIGKSVGYAFSFRDHDSADAKIFRIF